MTYGVTSGLAFQTKSCTETSHREHFIITPVCSKAQQACHNSNIKLKIIFHVGIINRIIVPIKEEDVIKIDINFHHTTLIQRKMIMT